MNANRRTFNKALATGLLVGIASLSTGCASIAEHQRHMNYMEEIEKKREATILLQERQSEVLAAWAMFNSKNHDGTPDIQAAATGLAILIQYSQNENYTRLVQDTLRNNQTDLDEMRRHIETSERAAVRERESSCNYVTNSDGRRTLQCQ